MFLFPARTSTTRVRHPTEFSVENVLACVEVSQFRQGLLATAKESSTPRALATPDVDSLNETSQDSSHSKRASCLHEGLPESDIALSTEWTNAEKAAKLCEKYVVVGSRFEINICGGELMYVVCAKWRLCTAMPMSENHPRCVFQASPPLSVVTTCMRQRRAFSCTMSQFLSAVCSSTHLVPPRKTTSMSVMYVPCREW